MIVRIKPSIPIKVKVRSVPNVRSDSSPIPCSFLCESPISKEKTVTNRKWISSFGTIFMNSMGSCFFVNFRKIRDILQKLIGTIPLIDMTSEMFQSVCYDKIRNIQGHIIDRDLVEDILCDLYFRCFTFNYHPGFPQVI